MEDWDATVEIPKGKSGILRVFEPGMTPGVDPYCLAATAVWIDSDVVELRGVTHSKEAGKNVFIMARKAIARALREHGVEWVIFIRHRRDGQRHKVLVNTQQAQTKYSASLDMLEGDSEETS